jgi:uncharacterized protein DUF4236
MSWGVRKSFKVAPGVRITASKKGMSVSGGPRGAKVSANTRGEKRRSLSLFGFFTRDKL